MNSHLGRIGLEDLSFFAEDEMIDIISNVYMNKFKMISGEYGPFEPMEIAKVPLWLAIILRKNNKCRIKAPSWMSVEKALNKDRRDDFEEDPYLFELPHHYIEISRLLLENCEEDIPDAQTIQSLLDTIIKVRENRMNEFSGMVLKHMSNNLERAFTVHDNNPGIKDSHYDLITGPSAIESNRLLSYFIPILEESNKNEDVRKKLLSNSSSVC